MQKPPKSYQEKALTASINCGILFGVNLKTEGIVLRAVPFKEHDRILTLFTPEGLRSFFVKIRKRDYLHSAALTSPWTCIEVHYVQGRGNLHKILEGTILSQHVRLRDRLETLQAADTMVQAILQSQWQDKPAPKLYVLLRFFLEQLPECQTPRIFSTAFLIKLLVHEGILQLSSLQPSCRYGGELHSLQEAPPNHILLTAEEEGFLTQIAFTRSLAPIMSLELPYDFHTKIATLFQQAYN